MKGTTMTLMNGSANMQEKVNEYVDVRGVWPVYINGPITCVLRGKRRDISLEDAREVATALLRQ